MKVLVCFEKYSTRVFDVSNEIEEEKVFLNLFQERKKEGWYRDLIEMESLLFDKSMKGDWKAARSIIASRSMQGHEYERVETHLVK